MAHKLVQPLQNLSSTKPKRVIVFIDFDGTTAAEIASQLLLKRFADGPWLEIDEQLDRGEISFYECVHQQYHMLRGHRDELRGFAKENVQLRDGFVEFARRCEANNYQIRIVAEALDFLIEPVLEREGFGHLQLFCDLGVFEADRLVKIDFPHKHKDCTCGLGVCKGGHVKAHRDSYDLSIYIGDGSNDFCGAKKAI